jgi:hypothetical protein
MLHSNGKALHEFVDTSEYSDDGALPVVVRAEMGEWTRTVLGWSEPKHG